jgi:hypothetical protein
MFDKIFKKVETSDYFWIIIKSSSALFIALILFVSQFDDL